jgi:ADP-ribose pyrophosphatase
MPAGHRQRTGSMIPHSAPGSHPTPAGPTWERNPEMATNIPETTVVRHEEVYRGKVVNLVVDTIALPSGRTAVREVVQHPGGVVAIPVLDDGSLVLIRQYRYPLQKFILEFPAGKLDSRQSPLDTIRRELEEEAGYSASTWSYECAFYTSPGFSDEVIHMFVARDLVPVPQRLEEGEHITVGRYSLQQCLEKTHTGEIADGKTLLGLYWYLQQITLK